MEKGTKDNDTMSIVAQSISDAVNQFSQPVEQLGMFRIRTANAVLQTASKEAEPQPLFLEFWQEGEVCCLFSDSNTGKSILAVQIGNAIAQTQKVLYFDFELSDKQFQLRYTDEAGNLYHFADDFVRVIIDIQELDIAEHIEETIVENIKDVAVEEKAKVIIIDNLTFLCLQAEKSDVAGILMMKLMQLKKEHGLSILVLAHTPKRYLDQPITQNSLAGSKRIFNFIDSCFAIGMSALGNDVRYLKQIKVRNAPFKYDANNVKTAKVVKIGNDLHFEFTGYSTEQDHLNSKPDKTNVIPEAKELKSKGYSIRQIADKMCVPKSTIERWLKDEDDDNDTTINNNADVLPF